MSDARPSRESLAKECPYCRSNDIVVEKQGFLYRCICFFCETSGPRSTARDEAIYAWNSLPRELPWTQEKPTVEGMYWCRCVDPCRRIAGPANIMYYTPGCELVEMYDEFAGPIRKPMEEKTNATTITPQRGE